MVNFKFEVKGSFFHNMLLVPCSSYSLRIFLRCQQLTKTTKHDRSFTDLKPRRGNFVNLCKKELSRFYIKWAWELISYDSMLKHEVFPFVFI